MHNTICDVLFKSFTDVEEESLVDKKDSVWEIVGEKNNFEEQGYPDAYM